MSHTLLKRFEKIDTPHPLGRHVEHDSRSREFAFQSPVTPIVKRTIVWPHSTPVLNQGDTESCTGNASAQLLNHDLFAPVRKAKGKEWFTEGDALNIYGLGTHNDGFGPDQYYPPNDSGGTGLGVAKAMQDLGYIDSYTHCFTITQAQAAIQTQPFIVGTTWTNSMFTPDPKTGLVTVGDLSNPAGGHEYVLKGVDYENLWWVFLNSWGGSWGGYAGLKPGEFRISFADFSKLLGDNGDIVVPTSKLVA